MPTYDVDGQLFELPDDVSQEEALRFIDSITRQQATPQRSDAQQQDMLFGEQQGRVGAQTVDPLAEQPSWAPAKSPLPKEAAAAANVPPTTGQVVETDQTSNLGDMGYAALDELGTFLGLGAEGWEAVKRSPLGASLAQGLGLEVRDPGEGIAMFKEALRAAGIPQQQVDNAASRFGSNLVWNAILTGLGVSVGRAMLSNPKFYDAGGKLLPEASIPGSQLGSYKIGRAIGAYPGEQMSAAFGGTITQSLTENAHGEDPVSSLVGYLPGMAMGTYGHRRLKGIYDWATRKDVTEPIANKFANPMHAKIAAEERIGRELEVFDNLTRENLLGTKAGGGVGPWNTRGGVRTSRMPQEQAQRQFEQSREYAEDTIRQVEERYWDAALEGNPIDTEQLILNVGALRTDLEQFGTEFTTPVKFFEQIEKLEPAVPPQKIQGLIRDIYAEIKRMRKDPTFSGDKSMYRANLNKLEDILRDALESNSSHPDLIEEARAITRNRKSRFDEGPMGEAKYLEGQGSTTIDTPKGRRELDFRRDWSAPLIARTSDGPTQLQAAHEMLESLGVRSSLADDFENAIRADYIDSVTTFDDMGKPVYDPKAAQAWMKKNAPNLNQWKGLLRELQDQTALMRKNAVMKRAIHKSVIARVAGASESSLQTQVNNAFGSPRHLKEVQDLTTTFSIDQRTRKRLPPNHDNIEAWEQLAVNALIARSKGDPLMLAKLLEDPIWTKNLEQAFINNPDRLDRLRHVASRAVILAKEGEKQDLKGLVRNTSILLGGVFGAKLGTSIGTGSIQVPGYTARTARGIVGSFMARVLPEPPGEKLWWAIHTPEGYNWMMSRVPDTIEGARKMVKQGRRMLALLNTQTHEKTRQWLDEWGVRPREDETE